MDMILYIYTLSFDNTAVNLTWYVFYGGYVGGKVHMAINLEDNRSKSQRIVYASRHNTTTVYGMSCILIFFYVASYINS